MTDPRFYKIRQIVERTHFAKEEHRIKCPRHSDDDSPDLNSYDLSDRAAREIAELLGLKTD